MQVNKGVFPFESEGDPNLIARDGFHRWSIGSDVGGLDACPNWKERTANGVKSCDLQNGRGLRSVVRAIYIIKDVGYD